MFTMCTYMYTSCHSTCVNIHDKNLCAYHRLHVMFKIVLFKNTVFTSLQCVVNDKGRPTWATFTRTVVVRKL